MEGKRGKRVETLHFMPEKGVFLTFSQDTQPKLSQKLCSRKKHVVSSFLAEKLASNLNLVLEFFR